MSNERTKCACKYPVVTLKHRYTYYLDWNGMVVLMFDAKDAVMAAQIANQYLKTALNVKGKIKAEVKKAFKLKSLTSDRNLLDEGTIEIKVAIIEHPKKGGN